MRPTTIDKGRASQRQTRKITGFFPESFHGGTGSGTVIYVTALAPTTDHFAPQHEWSGLCGGLTQQSQGLRWRSE